ncbi:MAG: hypothetical protein ACRCTA_02885, partial [Bacilli bacterium]
MQNNIHSKGVAAADSIAVDKIGDALEALNKVNGSKTKYKSKHIILEQSKEVSMVDQNSMNYTTTKVITRGPLSVEQLLNCNGDETLKQIKLKYQAQIDELVANAKLDEKVTKEDLEYLKKLDIATFLGYN